MANALRSKVAKLELEAGLGNHKSLPVRVIMCDVRFKHSDTDADQLVADAGLDGDDWFNFIISFVHPEQNEPANHEPKILSVGGLPWGEDVTTEAKLALAGPVQTLPVNRS